MDTPEAPSWRDELLEEALGLAMSETIGAVGLFLGGGIALAAWNVVESKLHLGRAAAAAAAQKIASVTLRTHELVTGDLAMAASKKAVANLRTKLSATKVDKNEAQLRSAFFDTQIATLSTLHVDAVTSLTNRQADYEALEKEHPGFGFAALEAYRHQLTAHPMSVIAVQRQKTLGQWMSLLARLALGTHQPGSDKERAGASLDKNLYQPTDDHHRIKDLAAGVVELHVSWDYDRMSDAPVTVETARVRGLKDSVKVLLTEAPLRNFGVPLLVHGKVNRLTPMGVVSHSHLGIARNEGGTLWLGAKANSDAADMLIMLGDGDPYEGARKLLAHIEEITLRKVD